MTDSELRSGPRVLVRHEVEVGGWIVRLRPEGPAGSERFRITERMSVYCDVLEPTSPLLAIVFAESARSFSGVDLDLAELLFGVPTRSALAAMVSEASVPYAPPDSLRRRELAQLMELAPALAARNPLAAAYAMALADEIGLAELACRQARPVAALLRCLAATDTPTGIDASGHNALTGDRADLDRAIALADEALAQTAMGPGRGAGLNSLANLLSARHALTGDRDDLDRAIVLADEALAVTATSPGRGERLNSLANLLSARHALTGDRDDLDRAIALADEALAVAPRDRGLPRELIALGWLASLCRRVSPQTHVGLIGLDVSVPDTIPATILALPEVAGPPSTLVAAVRGVRAAHPVSATEILSWNFTALEVGGPPRTELFGVTESASGTATARVRLTFQGPVLNPWIHVVHDESGVCTDARRLRDPCSGEEWGWTGDLALVDPTSPHTVYLSTGPMEGPSVPAGASGDRSVGAEEICSLGRRGVALFRRLQRGDTDGEDEVRGWRTAAQVFANLAERCRQGEEYFKEAKALGAAAACFERAAELTGLSFSTIPPRVNSRLKEILDERPEWWAQLNIGDPVQLAVPDIADVILDLLRNRLSPELAAEFGELKVDLASRIESRFVEAALQRAVAEPESDRDIVDVFVVACLCACVGRGRVALALADWLDSLDRPLPANVQSGIGSLREMLV